jgi:hypothetical protein
MASTALSRAGHRLTLMGERRGRIKFKMKIRIKNESKSKMKSKSRTGIGRASFQAEEIGCGWIGNLTEYSNRFHHETNPAWDSEHVNDGELQGFVRRTLEFIKILVRTIAEVSFPTALGHPSVATGRIPKPGFRQEKVQLPSCYPVQITLEFVRKTY